MLRVLILFLLLFYSFYSFAQSANGRMEYVFIDDEHNGIYTGGMHVKSGTIKVGEVIVVNDDEGNTIKLTVLKIHDYTTDEDATQLIAGRDGFLSLQTLDKKKIEHISGGFTIGALSKSASSSTKEIATHCNINNVKWNGSNYYKSSSYFPNGNEFIKSKKPSLIISFTADDKPDNRQLTIFSSDFKAGKGIVDDQTFEITITGSDDGNEKNSCILSNWEDGLANTKHTPFYLEFTKWEDNGTHILVSGHFHGKLYNFNPFKGLGVKLCKDISITNGVFENLKIEKN